MTVERLMKEVRKYRRESWKINREYNEATGYLDRLILAEKYRDTLNAINDLLAFGALIKPRA